MSVVVRRLPHEDISRVGEIDRSNRVRTVRVTAAGHQPYTRWVRFNQTQNLVIALNRLPRGPPAQAQPAPTPRPRPTPPAQARPEPTPRPRPTPRPPTKARPTKASQGGFTTDNPFD